MIAMKLIDADALCDGRVCNDPVVIACKCAKTVDAAPVRCGECRCAEGRPDFYYCYKIHTYVPKDFGCIIGERKDGGKR